MEVAGALRRQSVGAPLGGNGAAPGAPQPAPAGPGIEIPPLDELQPLALHAPGNPQPRRYQLPEEADVVPDEHREPAHPVAAGLEPPPLPPANDREWWGDHPVLPDANPADVVVDIGAHVTGTPAAVQAPEVGNINQLIAQNAELRQELHELRDVLAQMGHHGPGGQPGGAPNAANAANGRPPNPPADPSAAQKKKEADGLVQSYLSRKMKEHLSTQRDSMLALERRKVDLALHGRELGNVNKQYDYVCRQWQKMSACRAMFSNARTDKQRDHMESEFNRYLGKFIRASDRMSAVLAKKETSVRKHAGPDAARAAGDARPDAIARFPDQTGEVLSERIFARKESFAEELANHSEDEIGQSNALAIGATKAGANEGEVAWAKSIPYSNIFEPLLQNLSHHGKPSVLAGGEKRVVYEDPVKVTVQDRGQSKDVVLYRCRLEVHGGTLRSVADGAEEPANGSFELALWCRDNGRLGMRTVVHRQSGFLTTQP